MKWLRLIIICLVVQMPLSCTKDDLFDDDTKDSTEQELKTETNESSEEGTGNEATTPEKEDPGTGTNTSKDKDTGTDTGSGTTPETPVDNGSDTKGNASVKGTAAIYSTAGTKLSVANGATVKLLNEKSKAVVMSTVADKNGNYSFSDVAKGTYLIQASKDGYFNKPDRTGKETNMVKCTISGTETVTANECVIYPKATVGIQSISWRQGNKSKGDSSDGVVLDITFKNLDLTQFDDYVFLYFFAGYDAQISKDNCSEKLARKSGDGTVAGYCFAKIPVSEIKNGQVKGYRDSGFCGWRGGSINYANKYPTKMAVYVSTAFGYGEDGFFGSAYVATGDAYSGISKEGFVKGF